MKNYVKLLFIVLMVFSSCTAIVPDETNCSCGKIVNKDAFITSTETNYLFTLKNNCSPVQTRVYVAGKDYSAYSYGNYYCY